MRLELFEVEMILQAINFCYDMGYECAYTKEGAEATKDLIELLEKECMRLKEQN